MVKMKMKKRMFRNKKGWMRIVEAFAAVLIIAPISPISISHNSHNHYIILYGRVYSWFIAHDFDYIQPTINNNMM